MDHGLAKQILLDITDILDGMELPYFLTYGTALGAYRDKGFCPDERDIDIGFLDEEFIPRAAELAMLLIKGGFELITINAPFTRCRAIKACRNKINTDLVSFSKWSSQDTGTICRFSSSRLEKYSMVYNKPMLEEYEQVELFGKTFNVPTPIEKYLELEYGPRWKVPKKDFVQRSRVKHFRTLEGIPNNLLEGYQS